MVLFTFVLFWSANIDEARFVENFLSASMQCKYILHYHWPTCYQGTDRARNYCGSRIHKGLNLALGVSTTLCFVKIPV